MGWFSPKPPLISLEKAWVERRMCWLADKFGIDRLLSAKVLLPTDEYFPGLYQGTPDCAQQLFQQLCEHMQISANRFAIEVMPERAISGPIGLLEGENGQSLIGITESLLHQPEELVAHLCTLLSHELLVGTGFLDADAEDLDWLVELLPVYLGIGIFGANRHVPPHSHDAPITWWRLSTEGYLPPRMFGYAFALFAYARQETNPVWIEHLRLDVSTVVREGMRFLSKKGESLFHPNTAHLKHYPVSESDLLLQLRGGIASTRIAALHEVTDQQKASPEVVEACIQCLYDKDRFVPGEAADTLASLGQSATEAIPTLIQILSHEDMITRARAARALGQLQAPVEEVLHPFEVLLALEQRAVTQMVAVGLSHYGHDGQPLTKPILRALNTALIECDFESIHLLLASLVQIHPEPLQTIEEYFHDEELCRMALDSLEELVESIDDTQP